MTDTVLDKLHPASFRGVSFYLKGEAERQGGRESQTFKYPKRDVREIEDMGKIPPIFSFEAIITGIGDDYFAKRDNFIKTLEDLNTPGLLVHPFYGSFYVYPKPYTVIDSINELCVARFNLIFEVVNVSEKNNIIVGSDSQISTNANNIISNTNSNIQKKYTLVNKISANFNDMKNKVNKFVDKIDTITKSINQVTDLINDLSSTILDIRSNINSKISTANNLAASITGIFNTIQFIAQNPLDKFNIMSQLFNFGQDDILINKNTQIRIDRQNNRDLLNNSIQVNATALACEALLSITFKSTDDINSYRQILEDQFSNLFNSILDDATYDELIDLRNNINSFLDSQTINTPNIVSITTNTIPMTVLAYNYYESLDNLDDLININNIIDNSFVSGALNILSQ